MEKGAQSFIQDLYSPTAVWNYYFKPKKCTYYADLAKISSSFFVIVVNVSWLIFAAILRWVAKAFDDKVSMIGSIKIYQYWMEALGDFVQLVRKPRRNFEESLEQKRKVNGWKEEEKITEFLGKGILLDPIVHLAENRCCSLGEDRTCRSHKGQWFRKGVRGQWMKLKIIVQMACVWDGKWKFPAFFIF